MKPARFGPYYRSDTPENVEWMKRNNKVRGRAPRNYFKSDFPKVQAYEGLLPPGHTGIEFWTDVPPDDGGIPKRPTWSAPGNTIPEQDWYEIDVVITQTRP